MSFFGGSGVLCLRDVTQEHPAEVPHHAGVPLALVVALHLRNILVEPFPMFVTHCSEVRGEEVEVGVEKVNLETFGTPYPDKPATTSRHAFGNLVPVCYQGSRDRLT